MEKSKEVFSTENQISDYLSVSVSTLQAMRLRGDGPPFYKLGGSVRYRFKLVEEWAEKQRRTSTRQVEEVDHV